VKKSSEKDISKILSLSRDQSDRKLKELMKN